MVVAGWVVAGALAVAGCAADSTSGSASGDVSAGTGDSTAPDSGGALPSVSLYVLDGKGGEAQTNLKDIFPAAKPVVMWFWAPF